MMNAFKIIHNLSNISQQCRYTGALSGVYEDLPRELDTTYIKVKMEVWEKRTITTLPESASTVASNMFTLFTTDTYLLKLFCQ